MNIKKYSFIAIITLSSLASGAHELSDAPSPEAAGRQLASTVEDLQKRISDIKGQIAQLVKSDPSKLGQALQDLKDTKEQKAALEQADKAFAQIKLLRKDIDQHMNQITKDREELDLLDAHALARKLTGYKFQRGQLIEDLYAEEMAPTGAINIKKGNNDLENLARKIEQTQAALARFKPNRIRANALKQRIETGTETVSDLVDKMQKHIATIKQAQQE